MKRIVSILLVFLLTTCSAYAQTIQEQLNAPAHVSDIFTSNTGKTIITIEANVEIPDVEKISVLNVRPAVFAAEDVRAVAEACFTVPYSELPDSLERYQTPDPKVPDVAQHDLRIRSQETNANGLTENLFYTQSFQADGTPREGIIEFTNAAHYYGYHTGEEVLGESSEAAKARALEIAHHIAPEFELAYADRVCNMRDGTISGSRFIFTRSYGGVPSVYTSKDCTTYDNLADTYIRKIPYELRNWDSGNPFYFELANLLRQSMQGDFGIMTLPALAALPFAAQPLQEIKSGAIRPSVFRTGRRAWIMGKGIACFLGGMMLPLISVVILALMFHLVMLICGGVLFPTGEISVIYMPLLSRMICGGIWACIGCMIALLTETAAAAYLAPLCLCYALTMIGTRFFPQIPMLNPSNWLSGSPYPLLCMLIPIIFIVILTLRREVYRHA